LQLSAPNQSATLTRPVRKRMNIRQRLQELYRFRDLIYHLVVRELRARYKGSVLGFLWSLLNPLLMMAVFTVVFTLIMPNNSLPNYPIFLLCGLLPWNFFSAGVMTGIHSVVSNGNLVKKVYFPREVLPIASALAQLVNFLLALVVLFALLFVFQANLSPRLWMLPIIILIQTSFIIGIVLFLSAINVFYRDTMMIMDVVILAWFFMTPVFYPLDILPQSYEVMGYVLNVHRLMNILNPMASIINAYRDILYLGTYTEIDFLLRTALSSLAVLAFGYWFFTRLSGDFGEEL
jgi:lipopolysaccharide transport system permease protein